MERKSLRLASSPKLGFVSTYPPTICGLAKFSHSLVSAIRKSRGENDSTRIVRVVNELDRFKEVDRDIVSFLDPSCTASILDSVESLNNLDLAVIQHEFGIFGPNDGDAVLTILENINIPTIIVLHTVPACPTEQQRKILQGILKLGDKIVVLSKAAHAGLEKNYQINKKKVHIIPHGAHVYDGNEKRISNRPSILTWGLIGPSKGIEWGIRALPHLCSIKPTPLYTVWGQTHPNVFAREGEQYRNYLVSLSKELNVEDMLEIHGEYLDDDSLWAIVANTDVVLLPYESSEQVTSGVLIDAVAAGKPVVATRFPHAIELLSNGGGLLVPHKDPLTMASALHQLLTNANARQSAQQQAQRVAASLDWSIVAGQYEQLIHEVLSSTTASAVA